MTLAANALLATRAGPFGVYQQHFKAMHQHHLPNLCGPAFVGSSCSIASYLLLTSTAVGHRLAADPLPMDQMYHNSFSETPGKLTVPRSKRTTSQLEGYHGAALNHVVRGYNTSAELAIPQLTLTNDAWNQDREVSEVTACVAATRSRCHHTIHCLGWCVQAAPLLPPVELHRSCNGCSARLCRCFALQVVAGKVPEYNCHDRALLQDISSKLQHLGCEPLAGEWAGWGVWAGCIVMVKCKVSWKWSDYNPMC